MRKVLWIQGPKPAEMSNDDFLKTINCLAETIGGELVKFGENSHMIIGDDKAEWKYKAIQKQGVEEGKIKS